MQIVQHHYDSEIGKPHNLSLEQCKAHIANKFQNLHKNCGEYESLAELYEKLTTGQFGKITKKQMLTREILIDSKDSRIGKEILFNWQGLVDWDRAIDDCLIAMNSSKH